MRKDLKKAKKEFEYHSRIKKFFKGIEYIKHGEVPTVMQNLFSYWFAWWFINDRRPKYKYGIKSFKSWRKARWIVIADALRKMNLTPHQHKNMKKCMKLWIDWKKVHNLHYDCNFPKLKPLEQTFLSEVEDMANFTKDSNPKDDSHIDRIRRMIPSIWCALGGGSRILKRESSRHLNWDGSIPRQNHDRIGFLGKLWN